jgi:hypothetical protein
LCTYFLIQDFPIQDFLIYFILLHEAFFSLLALNMPIGNMVRALCSDQHAAKTFMPDSNQLVDTFHLSSHKLEDEQTLPQAETILRLFGSWLHTAALSDPDSDTKSLDDHALELIRDRISGRVEALVILCHIYGVARSGSWKLKEFDDGALILSIRQVIRRSLRQDGSPVTLLYRQIALPSVIFALSEFYARMAATNFSVSSQNSLVFDTIHAASLVFAQDFSKPMPVLSEPALSRDVLHRAISGIEFARTLGGYVPSNLAANLKNMLCRRTVLSLLLTNGVGLLTWYERIMDHTASKSFSTASPLIPGSDLLKIVYSRQSDWYRRL